MDIFSNNVVKRGMAINIFGAEVRYSFIRTSKHTRCVTIGKLLLLPCGDDGCCCREEEVGPVSNADVGIGSKTDESRTVSRTERWLIQSL